MSSDRAANEPTASAHAMRASLLKSATSFVESFIASPATFSIFRTVPSSAGAPSSTSTRTLFILDSSFNPPSLAHLTLATSGLRASRERYPGPRRLLLLFSVHNADKKAAPAPFEHRLAMMVQFAEDMAERIKTLTSSQQSTTSHEEDDGEIIPIDIGLTKLPYYNDKSAAIEEAAEYAGSPTHIHLTGFDTYTRIFTPKYYPNHTPPLSALNEFFSKHGLRVTIRTDSEHGKDDRGEWGTAEVQRNTIDALRRGDLEDAGGKREWAERVDIEEGEEAGKGVSSTKIRSAVKTGDWQTVSKLCTPRVVDWARGEGLYIDGEQSKW